MKVYGPRRLRRIGIQKMDLIGADYAWNKTLDNTPVRWFSITIACKRDKVGEHTLIYLHSPLGVSADCLDIRYVFANYMHRLDFDINIKSSYSGHFGDMSGNFFVKSLKYG